MPVIDLIIRIKNGYLAKLEQIESPYSKYREAVLVMLKHLGFVQDFTITGDITKKITITLVYQNGVPVLTDVKIFSTPGKRMYTSYKDLKSVKGGMGHSIVSTSRGIITGSQAKKEHIGGELLFHIW